jgi:hypothetical protein
MKCTSVVPISFFPAGSRDDFQMVGWLLIQQPVTSFCTLVQFHIVAFFFSWDDSSQPGLEPEKIMSHQ